MKISKNFSLVALALLLLLPGCGKKEKTEEKKVALSEQKEIPVLKEEVEEFFDDDNIQEFAFVDDDKLTKDENLEQPLADENLEQPVTLAVNEPTPPEEETMMWEEEETSEEEPSEIDTKNAYSFKTVYFDLNKNNIRKDQKEIVKNDVEMARDIVSKGKTIVVGGHCCQLGSPSYNLSLSERRANAIKKEMVKNGIAEENIKAIGYGQEVPVVWSDSSDKKALVVELAPNRRAELVIN